MENDKLSSLDNIVDALIVTYQKDPCINFSDQSQLPAFSDIRKVFDLFFEVLFPGYISNSDLTTTNVSTVVGDTVRTLHAELSRQIQRVCSHTQKNCKREDHEILSLRVIAQLPTIRNKLKNDVEATYRGDPAAQSPQEIVLSYPGILAIATHRIVHELYREGVPFLPRMISEYAHRLTGIDINPGASIGDHFFIDHGTGIVIGETVVIGNHVQIYQGVTLGALAPAKGQKLRGVKRHPTIEDDVTIYAEATILGDVTIGKGSVIGGNVWIKHSVPPYTIVMMPEYESVMRSKKPI